MFRNFPQTFGKKAVFIENMIDLFSFADKYWQHQAPMAATSQSAC